MKKLLSILLAIFVIAGCLFYSSAIGVNKAEIENTIDFDNNISEDYIPSEQTEPITLTVIYSEPEYSISQLRNLMEEQLKIQEEVHLKAEEYRSNGYTEDSKEIQEMKNQWNQANELYKKYLIEYKEKYIGSDEYWADKEKEHPVGTYVWKYMKDLGYSDAVAAGIMGNMMLECGGGFDLKWYIWNSEYTHYGLCQWSRTYFPEVIDGDLETQMNCLRDTIKEQIDEAGFVYGGQGFGYEEFLQLEDPAEVAVCFAMAYERCARQHVWPRRGFAEEAYEYFTN